MPSLGAPQLLWYLLMVLSETDSSSSQGTLPADSATAKRLSLLPLTENGRLSQGQWELADEKAGSWLTVLKICRAGYGPTDRAKVSFVTDPGARYEVSVAVVAVVGKLQVMFDGRPILTADHDGVFRFYISPQPEGEGNVQFGFRCVGRSDASAIVSEFAVEEVESRTSRTVSRT